MSTLREEIAKELQSAGLDPAEVERVVRVALDEDLAFGPDVTTLATVPAGARATGDVVPRVPGVLAGVPVAAAVFDLVGGADVEIALSAADGRPAVPGTAVLSVTGRTQALLTAERTALNFLGRLSGVATLTRRYVEEIRGTGAAVLDTRKTTPGLRALEKHAVAVGGGRNHRFGLDDGVLVKDNHLRAAGSIAEALERLRAATPLPIEVECDTLAQVDEALDAGADAILLDNMGLDELRAAVARAGGRARLEASGGVSLENVRAIAETGVDEISVGALTHSARSLDVSLELT
jgi:nicotinate-nucleotide pyrophosphorylase (carboxylating)